MSEKKTNNESSNLPAYENDDSLSDAPRSQSDSEFLIEDDSETSAWDCLDLERQPWSFLGISLLAFLGGCSIEASPPPVSPGFWDAGTDSMLEASPPDADPGDAAPPADAMGMEDVMDPGPDPRSCTQDSDCGSEPTCEDHWICPPREPGEIRHCVPAPPRECDDGASCNGLEACTPDSADADPITGCSSTPPTSCDDGLVCNGVESCDPAEATATPDGCVAGIPIVCNDSLMCTMDSCMEPTGECIHQGPDLDGDGFVERGCAGGRDCDDSRPNTYPGARELCNGRDDNCSGSIDDHPSFNCEYGAPPQSCRTRCGSTGTQTCTECRLRTCRVPSETCNFIDDDCDGVVDEGCLRNVYRHAILVTCGHHRYSTSTSLGGSWRLMGSVMKVYRAPVPGSSMRRLVSCASGPYLSDVRLDSCLPGFSQLEILGWVSPTPNPGATRTVTAQRYTYDAGSFCQSFALATTAERIAVGSDVVSHWVGPTSLGYSWP